MSALRIDLAIKNIMKQKLNSFNRLINIEYTKELINQIYELKAPSFVTDIQVLTFNSDKNIIELIKNSKIRIREFEEIQTLNSKSEETRLIKNVMYIRNPRERKKQISLLSRFKRTKFERFKNAINFSKSRTFGLLFFEKIKS